MKCSKCKLYKFSIHIIIFFKILKSLIFCFKDQDLWKCTKIICKRQKIFQYTKWRLLKWLYHISKTVFQQEDLKETGSWASSSWTCYFFDSTVLLMYVWHILSFGNQPSPWGADSFHTFNWHLWKAFLPKNTVAEEASYKALEHPGTIIAVLSPYLVSLPTKSRMLELAQTILSAPSFYLIWRFLFNILSPLFKAWPEDIELKSIESLSRCFIKTWLKAFCKSLENALWNVLATTSRMCNISTSWNPCKINKLWLTFPWNVLFQFKANPV